MARQRRSFKPATSYHVTKRCNNQAFDLRRPQSRKAILFCLARARGKFDFVLFGVCVMSNHVHYMIRPAPPADMPRLMHWLNWYSAMLLNRLLRRRGHFWERRYHATAVPDRDFGHALRVLRYIHANPRAAGMIPGYAYAYSNYRCYARPADDGLSAWHPAYLRLAPTLDRCARRYELFCRRYRSEPKQPSWPRWGGWRLWRQISGKPAKGQVGEQADLFAPGARYHGGSGPLRRAVPVAILRPDVLDQVERFIRVNQPHSALSAHYG
jgi:putative transposase